MKEFTGCFKRTAWGLVWVTVVALSVGLVSPQPASATVYKYEWVSQSGTVSPNGYAHQYTGLVAGQTVNLWLTLTNRSGTTIKGKSGLPIESGKQVPVGAWGIGTQNPQDGTPYFLDSSSFILNNNRFVYYDNENLGDWPDGYSRTMGWTIKLANNLTDGVYNLYYRPVCEYSAWTRQYKNGHTLPGTDSDIFTRFVVGSGTSSTYLTYTNQQYGFSVDYATPVYPEIFGFNVGSTNPDFLASGGVGVPDTGSVDTHITVWKETNLTNVVNKITNSHAYDDSLTTSYLNQNGLSLTVFKYHTSYADANVEERVAKLPSGYVVSISHMGWFRSSPDQRFLNSLKSVSSNGWLTYTDQYNHYAIQYPAGWVYSLQTNSVVFSQGEGDIWEFFVTTVLTSSTLRQNVDAEVLEKINNGYTVETSNTTINGQSAIKIHYYSSCCGGDYVETLAVYNGRLYTLSPHGNGSDSNQSTMLNSFRFIQ